MAEKTEKPQKQKRPDKAGRQAPGKAREAAAAVEAKPREPEPKIPARLRLKFEHEVAASLMRELKIETACGFRAWKRSPSTWRSTRRATT